MSTGGIPMLKWSDEATPEIEALMAAAGIAVEALHAGHAAMLSAAGQVQVAAEEGQRWLAAHRCPLIELEERLFKLFDR